MNKLIRITTIPASLNNLLEGQLIYMKDHYEVIAISSNKKELLELGRNNKIRTFNVNLTRKITPITDLKAIYKLYVFLLKEKPLIVHSHTPKAGLVTMIASYMAKVPNRLHTVAGLPLLEARGGKRRLLNLIEKLTYFCATKVYPNSFGLKQIILDNKFTNNQKLKVIANGSSNGINLNHFDPEKFSDEDKVKIKKDLNITKKDFVFIFVGRLVSDKGVNEIVEAFDQLTKLRTNIKLLLVGGEEKDLDPLNNYTIHKIEKNKNILKVGFQKDVRPFFAVSDLLVFPSYREGFPNVVMQAGAMGLTSIVSDINGCNEIIKEGINGSIIPVKNIGSLLMKMSDYLDLKEKIEEMKLNSRNIINKSYKREVVLNELLKEYKALESV